MFLALLRAHFNPRYARAEMILSRAKNIFMPANVNVLYCYIKPNQFITKLYFVFGDGVFQSTSQTDMNTYRRNIYI